MPPDLTLASLTDEQRRRLKAERLRVEAPTRRTITYRHAERDYDLSRSTLKRMVKSGRVRAIKVGRRTLLVVASIEAALGLDDC